MTERELIKRVHKATKQAATQAVTKAILAAGFGEIATALAKGDTVRYAGFGTFAPVTRKARTGRNPRTGEPLSIPARRVPVFRPGKVLKEMVAGG